MTHVDTSVGLGPTSRPVVYDVGHRALLAYLAITSCVIGGLCAVAIGMWLGPIASELGWSNARASSIATAFLLALLVSAPLAGAGVDKLGARSVMMAGIVTAAAGFAMVAMAHATYAVIAAFILVGIGNTAAFYVPTSVVVSNVMGDRRSFGTGIIWAAMSIGAALFSVAIGWGIDAFGWRITAWSAAALAAIVLPLPYLALPRRLQEAGKPVAERTSLALFSSRTFVVGTTASAAFGIGMMGIYYHVVSILIAAGYSARGAGMVFGASWLFSATGSVVLGALAVRMGALRVLAFSILLCACGTLLLLGVGHATLGVASVAGFLILWGSTANCLVQFVPVIFAERFGPTHLGAMVGVQSTIVGVIGAGAPILTGYLYDQTANYRLSVLLCAAMMLLGFALLPLISNLGEKFK